MTPSEYFSFDEAIRQGAIALRQAFIRHGQCWNSSPDRIHYLGPDGTCAVCGAPRLVEISGRVTPMKPYLESPCIGCGTLTVERCVTGWSAGWDWKTNGTSPYCATCRAARAKIQWARLAGSESIYPRLKEEAQGALA